MTNVVTTTNLIQGPADLYVGDFGATEPTDGLVNSAPAASAWSGVGGTLSGVEWTINRTFAELEVDQIVDLVESRLTKRGFAIKTQLAEATLDNLKLVLNGGTLDSGAGFQAFEPDASTSATQPLYKAILLDGYAPDSKRRRFVLRRVLATDDVGIKYGKSDQGVWTVTFIGHYVSASIRPYRIIDEVAA
jgi:hypothetical protein